MMFFCNIMQITYYSMDCMFFSDTYFTWGFDDKIKKKYWAQMRMSFWSCMLFIEVVKMIK